MTDRPPIVWGAGAVLQQLLAADDLVYAPAEETDWVDPDPTGIRAALDTLAARDTQAVLCFAARNVLTTTTTRWLHPTAAGFLAQVIEQRMTLPVACSLRNMFVYHGIVGASPVGGTITYTVFKNGVSTALKVDIGSGSVVGSNTSDRITFAKGDEVSVQVTKPVPLIGAAPRNINVSIEVAP